MQGGCSEYEYFWIVTSDARVGSMFLFLIAEVFHGETLSSLIRALAALWPGRVQEILMKHKKTWGFNVKNGNTSDSVLLDVH